MVIGSWNTIAISAPRRSRASLSGGLAREVDACARAVAEADAARVDPAAAVVDQPRDRQRGDRFARAGLADDRDGFSIGYRDIEPLDSSDGSAIRRKTDGKADNVEEWNSRGTGRHRMAA